MTEPVYPKDDPEYRKKVLERFRLKVKNTNWSYDEEGPRKPRGRKPKIVERIVAKPRPQTETNTYKNKFFNFS